MRQILFRPEIPFGRLHRRMAKQQVNLLHLSACGTAQRRRRAT